QQDWQAFNLSDTIAKKGTQVSYNVNGLKETQSHPATGTTHFYYDNNGQLRERVNANGDVTSTQYNAFGDVASQRLADTTMSTHHYDNAGRIALTRDGEGNETHFFYNALGQLEYQLTKASGLAQLEFMTPVGSSGGIVERNITRFIYDARGNVKATQVALHRSGVAAQSGAPEYQVLQGLIKEGISFVSEGHKAYDHLGRLISEIDGEGRELVTQYHDGGRTVVNYLAGQLQSRSELDASGRIVKLTNGKHETISYRYDDQTGTVVTRTAAGIETRVRSNAHGEQVELLDGEGNRRLFYYDHRGNLERS
ncbi:hypothetical protein K6Y31_22075, partial [Motilimonas cestriensis]